MKERELDEEMCEKYVLRNKLVWRVLRWTRYTYRLRVQMRGRENIRESNVDDVKGSEYAFREITCCEGYSGG